MGNFCPYTPFIIYQQTINLLFDQKGQGSVDQNSLFLPNSENCTLYPIVIILYDFPVNKSNQT